MNSKLKILDIEDKGESFQVKFEVPGELYNQDYPRRLAHSFEHRESYFEELENGRKRFEQILYDIYIDRDTKKVEKSKSRLDEIRGKVKGKELE